MRVITIASTKGGVGKTTLASALAVKAVTESARVAMVDLDPLGSLAAWWARRGSSESLEIFSGADTASEAVEKFELADPFDVSQESATQLPASEHSPNSVGCAVATGARNRKRTSPTP